MVGEYLLFSRRAFGMLGPGELPESALANATMNNIATQPSIARTIHSLLVLFPMVLWPSSLVFDVFARCLPGMPLLAQVSFWTMACGVIAALASMPAGWHTWINGSRYSRAHRLAMGHGFLGVLATAITILNLALRWNTTQVTNEGIFISALAVTTLICSTGLMMRSLAEGYRQQWEIEAASI